jgi:hypothetical protein
MKVIKPGNYEPELEGTCPRCGQVEQFDREELVGEWPHVKPCSLCLTTLLVRKIAKPEPIDRPIADEMTQAYSRPYPIEPFDIRSI